MKRDAPEPIVLVAARNVMRSRWPNIREQRFVQLMRAWAARKDVEALIVFDGRAPGGRLGSHQLDERTTVVGTGSGDADDWIADEAPRLAAEGRQLWLVSSDRGLRERVAAHAERLVGGGAFATQLETLERELRATS